MLKQRRYKKKELWRLFDELSEIKASEAELEAEEEKELKCNKCNKTLIYTDEGFPTCIEKECGTIHKNVIDSKPEWRFYGADDNHSSDPSRCGMPINPYLSESSFGCKVVFNGSYSYEMRKIKRYTEWQSMPYKEKALYDEFQLINMMASNAGISKKIIDDAIKYHMKISEYNVSFRGDNRDGIIAASIYIACRINNYPRTSTEIANIFHLDESSATKGCKNAMDIINIMERDSNNTDKTKFEQIIPENFAERYCSNLSINKELTKLCIFICRKIEGSINFKSMFSEFNPHSITAGIIYFISNVCNLDITIESISTTSNISEPTIKKCNKKLVSIKDSIVPKKVIDKYKK